MFERASRRIMETIRIARASGSRDGPGRDSARALMPPVPMMQRTVAIASAMKSAAAPGDVRTRQQENYGDDQDRKGERFARWTGSGFCEGFDAPGAHDAKDSRDCFRNEKCCGARRCSNAPAGELWRRSGSQGRAVRAMDRVGILRGL